MVSTAAKPVRNLLLPPLQMLLLPLLPRTLLAGLTDRPVLPRLMLPIVDATRLHTTSRQPASLAPKEQSWWVAAVHSKAFAT